MTFWRISCPKYPGGDYDHTFVNGEIEHALGLPGIQCEACGQTWSGTRTLPFALPSKLAGRRDFREPRPIPQAKHRALRSEVEAALAEEGRDVRLRPGDEFMPGRLRLPTFPEADFLWPGWNPVVSSRVRDLLTARSIRGVTFCEVTWEKLGQRRPVLPAPIPKGGEPESLLTQMPTYAGAAPVPRYFELVVTAESGMPPGVVHRGTCTACGRADLDTSARVFDVPAGTVPEHDVFHLATTLHVIVTDAVKELLASATCTNVAFTRLPLP